MSSNEHNINLSAFHDGELSESETVAAQRHLDVCAECRDELQELRELSSQIKSAFTPVPVMSQIERERLKRAVLPRSQSRESDAMLIRTARRLTRFAAALLIAGSGAAVLVSRNTSIAAPSQWEEIASRPGLLSEDASQTTLADWMASDLSQGGEKQ